MCGQYCLSPYTEYVIANLKVEVKRKWAFKTDFNTLYIYSDSLMSANDRPIYKEYV